MTIPWSSPLCRKKKRPRQRFSEWKSRPHFASSYRNYAVDFDGDGARDLLSNPVDAIGSVANYLAVHGWQRGRQVVRRVGVDGVVVTDLADQGLKPHMTLGDLRRRGLSVPGDLPDKQLAALIRLE